jgi:branched-chain amino acid transport system ATP-binding protein
MSKIHNKKTPVLKITNLSKNYGGLQVLSEVNLQIGYQELHALIGPNGAGKTTLFDIICGFIKPSNGTISFLDHDITYLPPYKRTHLGIGRTFQITTLFRSISVLDNLRLSLEALQDSRLPFLTSYKFSEKNVEHIKDLLNLCGLWEKVNIPVFALPYGLQRQLEIVMALIQKPKLLLLDEPMAGLEAGGRISMMNLIKTFAKDTTIFFIEHDMSIALQMADRVTVLHQGKVLLQGSPSEIQKNNEIQKIYFGR